MIDFRRCSLDVSAFGIAIRLFSVISMLDVCDCKEGEEGFVGHLEFHAQRRQGAKIGSCWPCARRRKAVRGASAARGARPRGIRPGRAAKARAAGTARRRGAWRVATARKGHARARNPRRRRGLPQCTCATRALEGWARQRRARSCGGGGARAVRCQLRDRGRPLIDVRCGVTPPFICCGR